MRAKTIRFNRFHELHPDGQRLIRDWFNHAHRAAADMFEAFVYLWFSFNSWMACVSEEETDRRMLDAIEGDRRLRQEFVLLMNNEPFRGTVTAFARDWPILNALDVRKRYNQNFHYEHLHERATLIEHLLHDERIRRRPRNWVPDETPRWEDLLEAVYQVRCNLFHGSKALHNEVDRRFVDLSFRILGQFIEAAGCYDMRDVDH